MKRLDKSEKCYVSDVLNSIPNKSALLIDVPCGSGRLSNTLSEGGERNYLGIDISDNMLEEARRVNPSLKYLLGNVLDLPIDSGEASLILCMRLLHHIKSSNERVKILRELARVSSKWVLVSFYRKECVRNFSKRLRGKEVKGHPISVQRFLLEAEKVGLSKRKIIYNWLTNGAQTLVVLEKIIKINGSSR
jgi:ubiquinone/menaquinone biosynthesis C-methylase UbiE